MSASDSAKAALQALPELPRDAAGPVFTEPWQAQAFAMAVSLNEAGYFTWKEWAEFLGKEINTGEDDYYRHWLAALEKIIAAHNLIGESERVEHMAAWDRAARATPHGEPIRLGRELEKSSKT